MTYIADNSCSLQAASSHSWIFRSLGSDSASELLTKNLSEKPNIDIQSGTTMVGICLLLNIPLEFNEHVYFVSRLLSLLW